MATKTFTINVTVRAICPSVCLGLFCCNVPFVHWVAVELHLTRKGNAVRCVACQQVAHSFLTVKMACEDSVAVAQLNDLTM